MVYVVFSYFSKLRCVIQVFTSFKEFLSKDQLLALAEVIPL